MVRSGMDLVRKTLRLLAFALLVSLLAPAPGLKAQNAAAAPPSPSDRLKAMMSGGKRQAAE